MKQGDNALLEMKGVNKTFCIRSKKLGEKPQRLHALSDINLKIFRGETLGVIGESGCGKSTLARCIVGLHTIDSGSIYFDGTPLNYSGANGISMRKRIQMIFQDPYSSLNPRKTCLSTIEEPYIIHGLLKDAKERQRRVEEIMRVVGLDAQHVHRYPHEFSGGQRQRINIARALTLHPDLLVCDEPVSALDVSIQAQVLNLLSDLQREFQLTYIFISHDLSIIKHISDRVAIMYLGRLIELCKAERVYDDAMHPYTKALLSAIPPDSPFEEKTAVELKGEIPSPIGEQIGCPLASRRPYCMDLCKKECPPLKEEKPDHYVACFLYEKQ